MRTLRRFLRDEAGATAIEYGLIAALVSVALITILTTLGTSLEATFQAIVDEMPAAGAGGEGG